MASIERTAYPRFKRNPGYSISWLGQVEFLERATAKLQVVVPFTLLIIFVLLYLTFKRFDEALLIMATLPFALVGGIWLLYLLGYNLSVAGSVGFIALAGVSAEFGVIMLLYLKSAWDDHLDRGKPGTADLLDDSSQGISPVRLHQPAASWDIGSRVGSTGQMNRLICPA